MKHRITRLLRAVVAGGLLIAPTQGWSHQAIDPKIVKQIPPRGAKCFTPAGDPTTDCIEKGRQLFESGTFGGNGRTCATCHPASNNFTIDTDYIAKLPPTDPLFVFETNPALADLETPLLRSKGLICENLDGFGPDKKGNDSSGRVCVLRSVPHTLGMKFSVTPDQPGNFDNIDKKPLPARPAFPLAGALGWGGDGSPGDGSLRNFAFGAVVQHFPKTMNRTPNVDFVLPTAEELDAMEAFQLSLGRTEEMNLNPDPTGANALFNCKAHTTCTSSNPFEVFELRLDTHSPVTASVGPNLEFTDLTVSMGQRLFFGGMETKQFPGATNIRSCSGCHMQAGAGSLATVNTPDPRGNRNRATGAEQSPKSPVCLSPVVFNADGGWGAGEGASPTDQTCGDESYDTNRFPFRTCIKTFRTSADANGPTIPPLSNPGVTGSSLPADVGVTPGTSADGQPLYRGAFCGNMTIAGAHDLIYFHGSGFFNTPSLIEAASTPPFFHNNIADTIEEAVEFYATSAFETSTSGNGRPFQFKEGQVNAVGAFLRAINALDSESSAEAYLNAALTNPGPRVVPNIQLAIHKINDAIGVLSLAGVNNKRLGGPLKLFDGTGVVANFQTALNRLTAPGASPNALQSLRPSDLNAAIASLQAARAGMLQ